MSREAERLRRLAALADMARDRVAALRGRLTSRLSGRVDDDVEVLRDRLGASPDLIFRRFTVRAVSRSIPAALVYVEGLTASDQVEQQVLRPLMRPETPEWPDPGAVAERDLGDWLISQAMPASQVKRKPTFDRLIGPLLSGDAILLVEGCRIGFVIGLRDPKQRSIGEPETETVIRGPRDGFNESLRTSTALVRRRLRSSSLRIAQFAIGRHTRTLVAVCYIQDIAAPELVLEVLRRLRAVEIDGVLESGYLEQFLNDNHYSPFPQVLNTERPDKVAASLLEGRVAVLTDGTPFALIVPAVFTQFYQTTEDYYERFHIASFVRGIRLLSLVVSLTISSLYVSLISFNPEMIPTKFAVAVAGGRAGVPVPAVVEVGMLEVLMEILREASLRLPRTIGNTISIVGVLVIGQAAVSSGFVSPIAVVIVALAAIGSFATPAFNAAIALRLLRFALVALAGLFGLYGVLVGLIIIVNHMLSLESFGVPYLAPVAPLRLRGLLDALVVRTPFWIRRRRPVGLQTLDRARSTVGAADVMDEKRAVLDPVRPDGSEDR